jgi:hypothetical protein
VVGGVVAGTGGLTAVDAATTPDVDGGVAAGWGVAVVASVVVGSVELADNCTGSIWPGAGGTVDASARVSPTAAPATRNTAAARLRGRARTDPVCRDFAPLR